MGIRVFIKLLDVIWGLMSFFPAILAIGGRLASRLHPARHMYLQWLGLFLPLILGINIILTLYWLWRKKLWFIIPFFAVLLNIPYLSGIVQWPFGKIAPAVRELKVVTYNIQEGRVGDVSVTGSQIAGFMDNEKVDILCLQEFPDTIGIQRELVDNISGSLPYYAVHSSSPQGLHIALFSRYPILRWQEISFPHESKNTAMWADLDIDGQTVRIFNVHLQTTNLNQNRIRPLVDIDGATSRLFRLKDMMDENNMIRARQADVLRSMTDESPYPLIVCGDFNDTPASYVYRKIKGDLEDSFRSCGKGYGYTYRYFRKLFRIDYVFYSRSVFRGTRYYSPELEYSDHKPVIVTLDFDTTSLSSEVQNQK